MSVPTTPVILAPDASTPTTPPLVTMVMPAPLLIPVRAGLAQAVLQRPATTTTFVPMTPVILAPDAFIPTTVLVPAVTLTAPVRQVRTALHVLRTAFLVRRRQLPVETAFAKQAIRKTASPALKTVEANWLAE